MKVVLKEARKVVDWVAMTAELIEKSITNEKKGKRERVFVCDQAEVTDNNNGSSRNKTSLSSQTWSLFVMRWRVETTDK